MEDWSWGVSFIPQTSPTREAVRAAGLPDRWPSRWLWPAQGERGARLESRSGGPCLCDTVVFPGLLSTRLVPYVVRIYVLTRPVCGSLEFFVHRLETYSLLHRSLPLFGVRFESLLFLFFYSLILHTLSTKVGLKKRKLDLTVDILNLFNIILKSYFNICYFRAPHPFKIKTKFWW